MTCTADGGVDSPRMRSRFRHLACLVCCTCLSLAPANLFPATAEQLAAEIAKFTKEDAARPTARDAIVFVGSSSVRKWTTLKQDFPGLPVVNRGFGGSQLSDCVRHFDQLVPPHRPRLVVLYAGENDLATGKQTADAVAASFREFCAKFHAALPQARLIYMAMKPSPSRWRLREEFMRGNALIAAECARDPRRTYLDVWAPMLDATGQPRPELFVTDMLHMNAAGYDLWTRLLAPLLKP